MYVLNSASREVHTANCKLYCDNKTSHTDMLMLCSRNKNVLYL
jgi:hypothetical protein